MSNYTEILQRKADTVREIIEQEVSSNTMELINELLEIEIELTRLETY
jgi:hypothetical protein